MDGMTEWIGGELESEGIQPLQEGVGVDVVLEDVGEGVGVDVVFEVVGEGVGVDVVFEEGTGVGLKW